MTDQAERLRGMVSRREASARENPRANADQFLNNERLLNNERNAGQFLRFPEPPEFSAGPPGAGKQPARVITITSGKGGVGKSNIALNLAIQFSKRGLRTVIIDADFGLANIEVLAGIAPKYHLGDVLASRIALEDALTPGPLGLRFLSGGSGMKELAGLGEVQLSRVTASLCALERIADIVLIDTGAGIDSSVMSFVRASGETVLVTTPEPTSITDAYAVVKSMADEESAPRFGVVVNRAESRKEGAEVFEKLNRVAGRFLGVSLRNLGYIPNDHCLVRAVKRQQPVTLCYPGAECSRSIEGIGGRLLEEAAERRGREGGIQAFIKTFVCGKK
ncbi:MAG: MinD/ParA family protein [Firmicutes bacterium]|nr:MinD/ParA family protein [Bacillota bacterium]